MYKPTSGTILNTTNAAMGSVSISTNYNPEQDRFTNLDEVLNN